MTKPPLYVVDTAPEDPRVAACRRQAAASPEIANLVAALASVARRLAGAPTEGSAQDDQTQTHRLFPDG